MNHFFVLIVFLLSLSATFAQETEAFLMPVEDVFSITGRGTVVTGKIESGKIKVGDEVELIGMGSDAIKTSIAGIEMFRTQLDQAKTGDNVGLMLKAVAKSDIKRGMIISKPGFIKTATEFQADIYFLSKEQGGRQTPFFNHFKPMVNIWTASVSGELILPKGFEMGMPGDTIKGINIKLEIPVAINLETVVLIKEGNRVIGKGKAINIIR